MLKSTAQTICIFAITATLALVDSSVTNAADLSGHWSGIWQSGSTRHQGSLQAEFVRLDADRYEVYFSGRFFRILPFSYNTVMTATEHGDVVTLTGSKYLGRLFGTFSFAATVNNCQFDANYSSCKDHGVFKMTRCTYCARGLPD